MTVIGTNVRRVDGAEKVAGQALYAGDLQLPGMACAKVGPRHWPGSLRFLRATI